MSVYLARFLTDLGDELEIAQGDALPVTRKFDITSLPFETMEKIIRFAYGPLDEGWKHLLFVNHHFRDITRRTSHLWTAVDVKYNPVPYLERSAFRGLHLSADDAFSERVQFERWIAAVDPHLDRWESFSIRSTPKYHIREGQENSIRNPRSRAHKRLCLLRDAYWGKSFPSLESLSVAYGIDVPVNLEIPLGSEGIAVVGNDRALDALLRSFFCTWDMPALRDIEIGGFIPRLPRACLNNITRCRLELGDKHGLNNLIYNMQRIHSFLRSLTSLKELSLCLFRLVEFLAVAVRPAEFSHLEVLTIRSENTSMRALKPLLQSFTAPSLRDLTIDARTDDADEAVALVEVLFPKDSPRFERLEALSFRLDYHEEQDDAERNSLETLFERLPRLQHLTVRGWADRWPRAFEMHTHFRSSSTCDSGPPLRTLRFEQCEELDLSFIFYLLDQVIKKPEFETLEIHKCPNVDLDILREAMPGGKKLKCTKYDWCTFSYQLLVRSFVDAFVAGYIAEMNAIEVRSVSDQD